MFVYNLILRVLYLVIIQIFNDESKVLFTHFINERKQFKRFINAPVSNLVVFPFIRNICSTIKCLNHIMPKDKNIWNTEPRDLSKEENNSSCIKMPSSTATRGVIMCDCLSLSSYADNLFFPFFDWNREYGGKKLPFSCLSSYAYIFLN